MSDAGRRFKQALSRLVQQVALRWMTAAKEATVRDWSGPVLKRRTGLLVNSLSPVVRPEGTRVVAGLQVSGPAALYGFIWEISGHRGFFLRPTRAKALSWVEGGQRFFSRGHFIKAQDPRPAMRPNIDALAPVFVDRMAQDASDLVARTLSRRIEIGKRG